MYDSANRIPPAGNPRQAKTASHDIGPKKTMLVLVVVVGCFAILWPKVFYPMLIGSANQHIRPSKIDKTTGCCDVFSDTDMNTIKIMAELCSSIVEQSTEKPAGGKELVAKCRKEIQQTCGIDISAVLQEQIRLGRTVKQILNEIRSLNGSLCFKYHYGVAPWKLGVPHRIANANLPSQIRQERPPHLRADVVHPAFRERGSAIPRMGDGSEGAKRPSKIVEGRPGPVPGMRPTMGGAGHVVPASQKTGSTMSVIMPIYTIGIVIFFTYTLMKLLFKKQPDGVGGSLYPPVEPDPRFRREVFESERCKYTPRLSRDPTGKIVVNAMSALLDEVDGEMEARKKTNLSVNQEQTSVKILGMETTASCEGGKPWSGRADPVLAAPRRPAPKTPPQEIYLQGALPAQSQILVSDSAVVTEAAPPNDAANYDPAVVLAGKMTLSVISLDGAKSGDHPIPSISVLTPETVELNGDVTENNDDDTMEESKYTTASSATVAERDISEEEATDGEGAAEDIEKLDDLEFEANHALSIANGVSSEVEGELEEAARDLGESYVEEIREQIVEEIEEIVLVEEEDVQSEEKLEEAKRIENANSSTEGSITKEETKSQEGNIPEEELPKESNGEIEVLQVKEEKDTKEIVQSKGENENFREEELQLPEETNNSIEEQLLQEVESLKAKDEEFEEIQPSKEEEYKELVPSEEINQKILALPQEPQLKEQALSKETSETIEELLLNEDASAELKLPNDINNEVQNQLQQEYELKEIGAHQEEVEEELPLGKEEETLKEGLELSNQEDPSTEKELNKQEVDILPEEDMGHIWDGKDKISTEDGEIEEALKTELALLEEEEKLLREEFPIENVVKAVPIEPNELDTKTDKNFEEKEEIAKIDEQKEEIDLIEEKITDSPIMNRIEASVENVKVETIENREDEILIKEENTRNVPKSDIQEIQELKESIQTQDRETLEEISKNEENAIEKEVQNTSLTDTPTVEKTKLEDKVGTEEEPKKPKRKRTKKGRKEPSPLKDTESVTKEKSETKIEVDQSRLETELGGDLPGKIEQEIRPEHSQKPITKVKKSVKREDEGKKEESKGESSKEGAAKKIVETKKSVEEASLNEGDEEYEIEEIIEIIEVTDEEEDQIDRKQTEK